MKKYVFTLFAMLAAAAAPAHAQQVVPQSIPQMQMSFAPLVKKTSPAVVNIYIKRKVQQRTQVMSPFFNDPFFSQFFNMPGLAGPVRERVVNSLGSGVMVDADGMVATNNHVIRDADEITVVTSDGREFEAQKILADDKVDLAILKIDTKGEKLPYLTFTDSDALQVGDIVLAIGNPFGVGQTVTSGIISGLARTDVPGTDYGFFIQTDAAINPGNSGGALVDINGGLVGINTAIFSKDGGSLGIGFAIPSSMVQTVVLAAKNGGKRLVRPWSGVSSQDVTPDMAGGLGLGRAYGTVLTKIIPDGPAARAGLKTGDVILAINGKEVQDSRALRFRLATVPIGTPVTLGIWRNGGMQDVSFTTALPPEIPPRNETQITGNNPLSGAVAVNISPAVQEEMEGLSVDKGVAILNPGKGAAARYGVRSGDIILSVNDKEIDSVSTLKKAVDTQARAWNLQIRRGEQVIKLTVAG